MNLPRILVVPGSNRAGSHNARLAGTVAKELSLRECEVTRITLRDYEIPIFDADLEKRNGPPENAGKLARMMHGHDGVVLVSPEYNASVPPLVKNTIDWISRIRSDNQGDLSPYRGKVFALASASPGKFGGIRSLYHLRASLTSVGALVLSEQLSVSGAASAFDEMDRLVDETNRKRLELLCDSIIEKARRLSGRL